MPELVTNPDFSQNRKRGAKYDFAAYADGNAYAFYPETDYHTKAQSFVTQVRQWAKLNGYDPKTKVVYDNAADEDEEVRELHVLVRLTPAIDEDEIGDDDDSDSDGTDPFA